MDEKSNDKDDEIKQKQLEEQVKRPIFQGWYCGSRTHDTVDVLWHLDE